MMPTTTAAKSTKTVTAGKSTSGKVRVVTAAKPARKVRKRAASSKPSTQPTATAVVRDRIRKGGTDHFWRPDDFADVAKPLAVDRILHRMASNGDLRAIRRGLYWRGRKTLYGRSHPSSDKLVTAIVGTKGVGPAGITAANDIGLTTQVPAVEVIAIPRRPPRPLAGFPLRFVDRSGRPARADCGLRSSEVAVLEVLGSWNDVVELPFDAAMRRLVELVKSGDVRADRLAAASVDEPASARARLKHLLADAGRADLAREVRPPAHRVDA